MINNYYQTDLALTASVHTGTSLAKRDIARILLGYANSFGANLVWIQEANEIQIQQC